MEVGFYFKALAKKMFLLECLYIVIFFNNVIACVSIVSIVAIIVNLLLEWNVAFQYAHFEALSMQQLHDSSTLLNVTDDF